jgi:hypothetical protein
MQGKYKLHLEEGVPFPWITAHVNGSSVRHVFDTASHELLVPHADACEVCKEDGAQPDEGAVHGAPTKMRFAIESVTLQTGHATVCDAEGDACQRTTMQWVVSADRLGYPVMGVGPSLCAAASHGEAPSNILKWHRVGFIMPSSPGASAAAWLNVPTPCMSDPDLAEHVREVPLYMPPGVKHAPWARLPCIGVVRVWVRRGKRGAWGCTRVDAARNTAMLDTGTPGTFIPREWLQGGEGDDGVDAQAPNASAPKELTIALELEDGKSIVAKRVVFTSARRMERSVKVPCIIGSRTMGGWAWEMDYACDTVRRIKGRQL